MFTQKTHLLAQASALALSTSSTQRCYSRCCAYGYTVNFNIAAALA